MKLAKQPAHTPRQNSSGRPLAELLRDSPCPACGDHIAIPFYDGGAQPLATLAWPSSEAEALAMDRLPLDFVRCVGCGHVYNEAFEADRVPYSSKPNLMFNRGALWQRHISQVCDRILESLPEEPVVVEIGCGDGHLLRALAERRPGGRYLGYDLNGQITCAGGAVEAHPTRFEPGVHVAEHRPDMVISRHLLEHLTNPLGFLQQLDFAVSWERLDTRLFIEVPCIDRVFSTERTADFFYEHNSNFTTESFRRLLERASASVEVIERSYDDEVIYGVARLGRSDHRYQLAAESLEFREQARRNEEAVCQQVDELAGSGRPVAVWGGTGKAAAFINRHGLDRVRFPVVVDSDEDKVGTHVPGTGQRIASAGDLLERTVDVILIATQWRARDIVMEIERRGISFEQVMLVHKGELLDYFDGEHPYRAEVGQSPAEEPQ